MISLMSKTSVSIFWNCCSRSIKSSLSKLRFACCNCFCCCDAFTSSSSLSSSFTLTRRVFFILSDSDFSDCRYFWTMLWNSETIFSSISLWFFSADENFTMEFNFLISIEVDLMISLVLFWMVWLEKKHNNVEVGWIIERADDSHFRTNRAGVSFRPDNLLDFLQFMVMFLDNDYVVVDGLLEDEKLCGGEIVTAAPWLRDTPVIWWAHCSFF